MGSVLFEEENRCSGRRFQTRAGPDDCRVERILQVQRQLCRQGLEARAGSTLLLTRPPLPPSPTPSFQHNCVSSSIQSLCLHVTQLLAVGAGREAGRRVRGLERMGECRRADGMDGQAVSLVWRGLRFFQKSTGSLPYSFRLIVQQTLARHLGCDFHVFIQ